MARSDSAWRLDSGSTFLVDFLDHFLGWRAALCINIWQEQWFQCAACGGEVSIPQLRLASVSTYEEFSGSKGGCWACLGLGRNSNQMEMPFDLL